jgi:hypothetical protein
MSLRIAAAASVIAALGGCSLGALDGFTSGDTNAGATDAGVETSVTTDDGATAPPIDASPSSDAGTDSRFCAAFSSLDVCADYDDDAGFAGWTKQQTGTSDVVISTSASKSAPGALRATAGAAGSNRWGFVERAVGTVAVSHARLTYALFVEEGPLTNELELNGLVFTEAKRHEFYLAVASNGASYIVEQTADLDGSNFQNNYHDLGIAIPLGQWVEVSLEVVLSGTKELVLSVDGTERTRKALALAAPGTPRVRAGITWADKTSDVGIVVVDDVRFDVLP